MHILTRKAMYIYCNTEVCSHNHCCSGKAISITHSGYVRVALVIQNTNRMHHTILSSVPCLALPHLWHNFPEKSLLNIKCVFWFSLQLLSQIFLILRNEQDIFINVHRLSCKLPIILANLLIFSTDFQKTLKYQISCNSIQWALRCFMQRDEQPETWWRKYPLFTILQMCLKIKSDRTLLC